MSLGGIVLWILILLCFITKHEIRNQDLLLQQQRVIWEIFACEKRKEDERERNVCGFTMEVVIVQSEKGFLCLPACLACLPSRRQLVFLSFCAFCLCRTTKSLPHGDLPEIKEDASWTPVHMGQGWRCRLRAAVDDLVVMIQSIHYWLSWPSIDLHEEAIYGPPLKPQMNQFSSNSRTPQNTWWIRIIYDGSAGCCASRP